MIYEFVDARTREGEITVDSIDTDRWTLFQVKWKMRMSINIALRNATPLDSVNDVRAIHGRSCKCDVAR